MSARRRPAWDAPTMSDDRAWSRYPTHVLPVGFPFVTCRPACPGCHPCAESCTPVTQGTCQPGTLFFPTTCLPSTTCMPTVPPGCVPRPCTPV